jgi:hypothetical protein
MTVKSFIKVHLHSSKNRSKLVHFKEQKQYFPFLKGTSFERFSP